MTRSRGKVKGRKGGLGFGALPREVWMSPDYCNLTGGAAKLLMDLACQFNGRNNGDLTVAYSVLDKRGWSSKTTITRAVRELQKAGLIRESRPGQFTNPGGRPALYELTWLPTNECPGKNLTLPPRTTPFRKFSLEASKAPAPGKSRSMRAKVTAPIADNQWQVQLLNGATLGFSGIRT